MTDFQLHLSWLKQIKTELNKPYMLKLKKFLTKQKQQGKTIYPPYNLIFNALNTTHFEKVKVVIVGQDPYHGRSQAHGLSFSVNKNVPIPPSLKNIYKELHNDIGFIIPNHGNLQMWAKQGVLLLNSVLTVNKSQAASHQGIGWELFTDKVIELINKNHKNIVYMLWGTYAQNKGAEINVQENLILKSAHPSPLSAYRGFLGCKHFSQCNEFLKKHNKTIIDWHI